MCKNEENTPLIRQRVAQVRLRIPGCDGAGLVCYWASINEEITRIAAAASGKDRLVAVYEQLFPQASCMAGRLVEITVDNDIAQKVAARLESVFAVKFPTLPVWIEVVEAAVLVRGQAA